MINSKITAFGRYLPEKVVTNDDLSKIMETDDEWISSRTGIKQRHISMGENTSDLCVKAAEITLEKAGVPAKEIDLIIVATITPDYATPSTACLVQKGIGADRAVCFDISAACSGFVYAFSVANKMIKASNGLYKRALVFGAETLSKMTDWSDRATAVLFGDGAGCALIEATDGEDFMLAEDIQSFGEQGSVLTARQFQVNNAYCKSETENDTYIRMDGREVFAFATRQIPKCINKLLENSSLTADDVKYIIPHQANLRIVEAAAKKLKLDLDQFYINIQDCANTSAASIPIALGELWEKGLIQKGDKLIIVGFGGGLTVGGCLLQI